MTGKQSVKSLFLRRCMFFNSVEYLLFLPATLILFFAVKPSWRWAVLFGASCIFYMYFIPKYILCLFFLILVDFYAARRIEKSRSRKARKGILILSIVSNFGLLFYFKYSTFFAETLNYLTEPVFGYHFSYSTVILPIGLSFHTFQSVSYVIDVFKRKIEPENHLGYYASYVLFFPQMVAGPIERYDTLGIELKKNNNFNPAFLKTALPLMLTGFFYKMIVADNCGEYVNKVYSDIAAQNTLTLLSAVALFCVQIYSDFFGYSLIAQGSAKLFGIHLIDNFSFPFFSGNIITFWRKWHISLTSWFRDYVYFPLGGSRKGTGKHVRNLLIVFSISGLWHGAGMNFIFWGLLHGIAYVVTYLALRRFTFTLPKIIGAVMTFCLVAFIFVFFRSSTFSEASLFFRGIFNQVHTGFYQVPDPYLLVILVSAFFMEYHARRHINFAAWYASIHSNFKLIWILWLFYTLLVFAGTDNIPFIYFQF